MLLGTGATGLWAYVVSDQKCNPSTCWNVAENDDDRRRERDAQECANNAPDDAPKRQRDHDDEWAQVQSSPHHGGLDDIADDELHRRQSDGNHHELPHGVELNECKDRREDHTQNGTDAWNEVEQKNEEGPGFGKIDSEKL